MGDYADWPDLKCVCGARIWRRAERFCQSCKDKAAVGAPKPQVRRAVARGGNGLCGCGQPSRSSGRYCKACHAAYTREWRKSNPLTGEARRKANVRHMAKTYHHRGYLIRQPCAHCGEAKTEKHHPDYSKPLFVVWLCRPCHLAHHKREEQMKSGHLKALTAEVLGTIEVRPG